MKADRPGGVLLAVFAFGVTACRDAPKDAPDVGGGPDVAGFIEPPLLEDLDPAEGRFEGVLSAAPVTLDMTGEDVEFLAYNGSIPGPLIRVGLGDAVSIRFDNQLPDDAEWASGIHWHGIEGYNASDGTPVTQVATMPGESFTYEFRATRAGTFWYHPHVRGAQALFAGLYAPLVVVDPDEAELIERPNHIVSLTEVRSPFVWHAVWLRLWLGVISWFGRWCFVNGVLGKATGIKYGHWHVVDGGRRLRCGRLRPLLHP